MKGDDVQDWTIIVAKDIKTAEQGGVVTVKNTIRKDLAERVCHRMGRDDLTIEVEVS